MLVDLRQSEITGKVVKTFWTKHASPHKNGVPFDTVALSPAVHGTPVA
jgi:hypothetical protein